MIIVLYLYSILVDLYIWNDIRRYCSSRIWHRVYAGISVACWIFLTVILCMPRRSSSGETLTVMWMLYSYLTVYVPKFFYVVCSAVGLLLSPKSRRHVRLNYGIWLGMPLAFFVCAMMWWGAFETRRQIMVSAVTVSSPKLPKVFDGYKIAQISDLHVGTWGNDTTFVKNLVDSVNSLHPDIIVFTGDLVNMQTSELLPFVNTLSGLKAPDGVVSILGNHDYGDYSDWESEAEKKGNLDMMKSLQKQMGWRMLNNRHFFMRRDSDSIAMIGVENWGEPPFHQYGDIEKAFNASKDSLHHLNDGRFKILLTHNPEHWKQETSENTDIALTLSGHTHAMQLMLQVGRWRWSPAKFRYDQWGGLYEKESADSVTRRIYVNIGAGEVGMPFRIGATPEVTLITLRGGNYPSSEAGKVR